MIPLKEATETKHKIAERMLFNQQMFRGKLTKEQYGAYLRSQLEIFSTLEENFKFPHEGLKRKDAVTLDLIELNENQLEVLDNATYEYCLYLKELGEDSAMPHIYLNYLAIMFGGQIIKSKVPGSGRMYEFDDMTEIAKSIRDIQRDDWADEVNKGFDFMINILKDLEKWLTTP